MPWSNRVPAKRRAGYRSHGMNWNRFARWRGGRATRRRASATSRRAVPTSTYTFNDSHGGPMLQRAAVFACVTAALVCGAAAPVTAEGEFAFSFIAANAPKTGLGEDRLHVTIDRWSTDSE